MKQAQIFRDKYLIPAIQVQSANELIENLLKYVNITKAVAIKETEIVDLRDTLLALPKSWLKRKTKGGNIDLTDCDKRKT
ncbi:MAG: hypothetical protein U9O87_10560 [Verrucomicrobiota bacterium]|nr:hypothetical protein [Verrucomicrobiota bacterium]